MRNLAQQLPTTCTLPDGCAHQRGAEEEGQHLQRDQNDDDVAERLMNARHRVLVLVKVRPERDACDTCRRSGRAMGTRSSLLTGTKSAGYSCSKQSKRGPNAHQGSRRARQARDVGGTTAHRKPPNVTPRSAKSDNEYRRRHQTAPLYRCSVARVKTRDPL